MLRREREGMDVTSQVDAERTSTLPSVEGYTLEARLGQGGMGTVYRARQLGAEHAVALKMLTSVDGAGIYRFKREFRILQDLTHPNLVLEKEEWEVY